MKIIIIFILVLFSSCNIIKNNKIIKELTPPIKVAEIEAVYFKNGHYWISENLPAFVILQDNDSCFSVFRDNTIVGHYIINKYNEGDTLKQ